MSFEREGRFESFKPSAPEFSPDYVRRGRVVSTKERADLTQLGGVRLKPDAASFLRIAKDIHLGVGMREYALLDDCVDARVTATSEVGGAFFGSFSADEIRLIKEKATATNLPNVYVAVIAHVHTSPLGKLTDEQVAQMQAALRPPIELTPAALLETAGVTERIAAIDAGLTNLNIAAAAHITTLYASDTEFRELIQASGAGGMDAGTIDGGVETLFTFTPLMVQEMGLILFSPLAAEVMKRTNDPYVVSVFEDLMFVKMRAAGVRASTLVEATALSDEVARARNEHAIHSFTAPDFMDNFGGVNMMGVAPPGGETGWAPTSVTVRFAVLNLSHNALSADDIALFDAFPGGEVYADTKETVNRVLRAVLEDMNAGRNAATEPASRFVGGEEDDEGAERRDLTGLSEANVSDVIDWFVPAGAASRNVGSARFVLTTTGGGDEANSVFTDKPDLVYNWVHLATSAFNAAQLVSEEQSMIYGFTKASCFMYGYNRDPGQNDENLIETPVFFSLGPGAVESYMKIHANPTIIDAMCALSVILFLKSGHHITAANGRNTANKLLAALEVTPDDYDASLSDFMNLCAYFGTHTSSTRLMYCDLLCQASAGRLSDAIRKRLYSDGPLLSGPRNVFRALVLIEATQFFDITNSQEIMTGARNAMARVNQVGYRMTPYAQYMYGESAAAPQGAINVLQDSAVYAAAFALAVPDSSLNMSAAMDKMAMSARQNDILTVPRVVAFVKAYRRFIEVTVFKSLQKKLGVGGNDALALG